MPLPKLWVKSLYSHMSKLFRNVPCTRITIWGWRMCNPRSVRGCTSVPPGGGDRAVVAGGAKSGGSVFTSTELARGG
jgi:hypothetical protein